jgi:NADPH2:quinone reductase
MRAVLCREFGPPEGLIVDQISTPVLEHDQVRLKVHYAGLNFPDILLVTGNYQAKPKFPFVPGLEVSGTVTEVGASVKSLKIGQRVAASTGGFGGFAEEVVINERSAFEISDGIGLAVAAGVPVTYGAAYHALVDRGNIKPGEWLLVLGAGSGVGLNAVELGKHLGAKVIAVAGSMEKLTVARKYGADHLINYMDQPSFRHRVREITGTDGADVIFDPVGGDAFDESLRCINWGGRLLVVGFASGRIPQCPANLALLKGCQIVGVFNGAFIKRYPERHRSNLETILRWIERGRIAPLISKRFKLENVAEAMREMSSRKLVGKVVIEVRRGEI